MHGSLRRTIAAPSCWDAENEHLMPISLKVIAGAVNKIVALLFLAFAINAFCMQQICAIFNVSGQSPAKHYFVFFFLFSSPFCDNRTAKRYKFLHRIDGRVILGSISSLITFDCVLLSHRYAIGSKSNWSVVIAGSLVTIYAHFYWFYSAFNWDFLVFFPW